MIAFMNSFFSYLLLFIVMAVIAGTGIFVGITMRKKKRHRQGQRKRYSKSERAKVL